MLKELREDYQRHGNSLRNPAFWLLLTYRIGRAGTHAPAPAKKAISAVYALLLTGSEFMLGSTLNRETQIGERLHIIHAEGIRIAPDAIIGDRVGIMQNVVIGTTPDRPGCPVIGNDVFIGAGAKILGPVKIGDRARIAANSLVIGDVPEGCTAVGVPARVMRYTGRPAGDGSADQQASS
jgi:serine O-acetyltransferase